MRLFNLPPAYWACRIPFSKASPMEQVLLVMSARNFLDHLHVLEANHAFFGRLEEARCIVLDAFNGILQLCFLFFEVRLQELNASSLLLVYYLQIVKLFLRCLNKVSISMTVGLIITLEPERVFPSIKFQGKESLPPGSHWIDDLLNHFWLQGLAVQIVIKFLLSVSEGAFLFFPALTTLSPTSAHYLFVIECFQFLLGWVGVF